MGVAMGDMTATSVVGPDLSAFERQALRIAMLAMRATVVSPDVPSHVDLALEALQALPRPHRVALTHLALEALGDGVAMDVIEAYVGQSPPFWPFAFLAEGARHWAAQATPRERKFYAWAVVERLTPRERRALVAKIQKMEASVPPEAAGGGGAR